MTAIDQHAKSATGQRKESRSYSRNRENVLRAAARLFTSQGYEKSTLREIADAVSLSKSGLYHYFPSKQDILAEIAQHAVKALTSDLEDALFRHGGNPEHLLEAITLGRMHVIAHERDFLTVFWREQAAMDAGLRDQLRTQMRAYLARVQQVLDDGQSMGVINPDLDPQIVMLGIVGMTGWSYLWMQSDGRLNPSEIGEQFWAMLRSGVIEKTTGV